MKKPYQKPMWILSAHVPALALGEFPEGYVELVEGRPTPVAEVAIVDTGALMAILALKISGQFFSVGWVLNVVGRSIEIQRKDPEARILMPGDNRFGPA